jgi:hypothetical protein
MDTTNHRYPFVSRRVGLCMARKPKVQTRLPEDTHERFEEYREAHELTKADATRRLVEAGLDAEADQPVTDGGYRLSRDEHPWVGPLASFGYDTARFGLYSLAVSLVAILVPGGAVSWFGVTLSAETAALFLSLFTLGAIVGAAMIVASVAALLALEYFMHPAEAPLSQYLPQLRKWREHKAALDT